MIVKLNTNIELGFLRKTWFSKLVFKCRSLRRIWIIQWFTCRVRTLVFFFTLSCMAAKCGHALGEMNFQKRFKGVLITSCTFIWEAAVAINFTFFFACWSEYCSIIIWVAPWTYFTTSDCEEMMIHEPFICEDTNLLFICTAVHAW